MSTEFEQLENFVSWERKQWPDHVHIAEWARDEILRLRSVEVETRAAAVEECAAVAGRFGDGVRAAVLALMPRRVPEFLRRPQNNDDERGRG